MDIKEAMGYVQAVADNCNDAPRYQRALQTLIDYVVESYTHQNQLIAEIAELHQVNDELFEELKCERYRHDRYADFTVSQSKIVDELKDILREHGIAVPVYVLEVKSDGN